jgi:predicted nucleic acid-binding protein
MAWLFKDEQTTYTEKVLGTLESGNIMAVVPSLWILEVTNVLLVAENKKRISHNQSLQFISILQELPIQVEQFNIQIAESIIFLAREYKLTSYDTIYLDLAIKKGLPIATLDKDLKKAAAQCGIKLYKPSH